MCYLLRFEKIRQTSLNADFINKLNAALTRSAPKTTNQKNSSYGGEFLFLRKSQGERKKEIVIASSNFWAIWWKYASARFKGSYLDVDLGDMRPANSLYELIRRGGTLRLHVPTANFPIEYLVGHLALISLTRMRNEPLGRNQTTRANTDTMLSPRAFYETNLNHRIAIRELGEKRLMTSWIIWGIWKIQNAKKQRKKPLWG